MTKRFRKTISLFLALLLCLLLTAAAYADSTAVIAEFEPLGDAATVETAFKLARITLLKRFPAELSVRLEGQTEYRSVPVTWQCTEDYNETLDSYHFTPVFEDYTLAEGLAAPEITVTVLGESVTPPLTARQPGRSIEIPIPSPGFRRSAANLPSYNAYESGRLPAVRDQNPYGTCWAFAALGAAEADLISDGAGTDIDLSELHLAYFSSNAFFDEKGCNTGDSYGAPGYLDNGGNTMMATRTLSKLVGAASEASAPYWWASDYTPDPFEGRAYKDAQLMNAYELNGTDIAGIKQAIYTHGGVVASICWDNQYFSYDDTSFYCPYDIWTNHDILLVGWDDSFPKENFCAGTPEGDGAWLVRNSWGLDDYGREGYFWMSYYDVPCSNNIKTAIDAQSGQFDHCYAYDSTPYGYDSWYWYSDSVTATEHFIVDGGEQISAVGLELLQAGNNVEIELSIGNKTVQAAASYTYPGYYTIELPEPLVVSKRSDVTVTIIYSGDEILIPVESTDSLSFDMGYAEGYCGSGGVELNGELIEGDARVKLFTMDCDVTGEGVRIAPVNFPDNAFRNYVSASFDTDRDGYLSDDEITAVRSMDLALVYPGTGEEETEPGNSGNSMPTDMSFASPETDDFFEISDSDTYDSPGSFASLEGLEYFTDLESLSCDNKRLQSLDLSGNPSLHILHCSGNMLTSLNLVGNTALEELHCSANQLDSLDLSHNTALRVLDCSYNPLTELDVSSNPYFTELVNDTLPILSGHSIVFSNEESTLSFSVGVHLTPAFTLDAGLAITDTVFPDPVFLQYVSANCDMDQDGTLSAYEISQITEINCSGTPDLPGEISSLTGVELFTALEVLNFSYCPVAQLDISANTALRELHCRGCALEQLDLRTNTELTILICLDNPNLSSLDISNCSQLMTLVCGNCSLAELSLNNNSALEQLYCFNNPLAGLDISNCTALTELSCFGCSLEELSLEAFDSLSKLYCYNNIMTMLDVSDCTNLSNLYCYNNPLTDLDVSGCTSLSLVSCFNTSLERLDLSGHDSLRFVYCYRCPDLSVLDVSGCYSLNILRCFSTNLSDLDLSDCQDLYDLQVNSTPRMVLDISACSPLCFLRENAIQQFDEENNVIYYHIDDLWLVYDADDTMIDSQPDFVLPDALRTIGEEAFAGGFFRYAVLSENTESVGVRAFADCPRLGYICIPNSGTVLDEQAFGDLDSLVIFGHSGSTAETFALDHGFIFVPIE